jgi:P27 family predicted phage terminase small subunit
MAQPTKTEAEHWLTGTRTQVKNLGDSGLRAGRPKIPSHLSRHERAQYKRLVAALEARGHATPGDFDMLAILASVIVRWQSEKLDLETNGLRIDVPAPDGNGGFYQKSIENPARKQSVESGKQYAALLKELGLTPRGRDSVKKVVAAKPVVTEENPFGNLMQEPDAAQLAALQKEPS